MINKNITTKKNFDEHKILILYYFITSLLRGVRWWYLICMHLQLSTLCGKWNENYKNILIKINSILPGMGVL